MGAAQMNQGAGVKRGDGRRNIRKPKTPLRQGGMGGAAVGKPAQAAREADSLISMPWETR